MTNTYAAPFQTNWVVGSQHTISTIEIQQGATGTRYLGTAGVMAKELAIKLPFKTKIVSIPPTLTHNII